MKDRHIFDVPEAFWPAVYKPFSFDAPDSGLGPKEVFGLSLNLDAVPTHLWDFLPAPLVRDGKRMVRLSSGSLAPRVIAKEGHKGTNKMSTILQFSRDANVPLDQLLIGIPMSIGGEVTTFKHPRIGETTRFYLRAIAVRYTDLLNRFDDLTTDFWK